MIRKTQIMKVNNSERRGLNPPKTAISKHVISSSKPVPPSPPQPQPPAPPLPASQKGFCTKNVRREGGVRGEQKHCADNADSAPSGKRMNYP